MEKALFHVMDDDERIVIFSMDHDGNRTVFCPGGQAVDEIWPRYAECKALLASWFDHHVGKVAASPYAEYIPSTPAYPRGLACALTHDSILSLWAYVTAPDILVSVAQATRALGGSRVAAERCLEEAGVSPKGNGTGHRKLGVGDIQEAFGRDTAGRIVLYSGQVADFLGVLPDSVPDIVKRLDMGLPDRSRVRVPWSKLRRVRRTGPRSFELAR